MNDLNLNLLRIDYEIFGENIPSISRKYGISESVIRYAVDNQGWQQNDLVPTSQDIDVIAEDVQSQLDSAHVLRQKLLDPRYIQLEAAIVNKAVLIVEAINADTPGAASQLKTASEILASLRPTSAMLKKSDDSQDKGVKVVIMNHAGDAGCSTNTPVTTIIGASAGSGP